jgi:hypothetical protein
MSEATGSATRKRRDATWFAVVAVWAVVGYIGLNTYAIPMRWNLARHTTTFSVPNTEPVQSGGGSLPADLALELESSQG